MKRILPFLVLVSLLLGGCAAAPEAPADDHAGHNHAPGEGH